jgi:glucan biosynthesis protein C
MHAITQGSTSSASTRFEFLDWLRVIAIFVLLFFHTGMLFVGWGWHVQNSETIAALVWPMDIAHRLRMPLLFVVAGAGMWFALRRRTGAQLVFERTLRLLIPLIVGMFLIVPPQIYFERLFHGQWEGGYLAFLVDRVFQFKPYPDGDFSWHHLWFIAYLYVYVVIMLPLLLWWKRRGPRLQPGAWLYALALPLCVNEAVLRPVFPETHNLVRDWYVFNNYLLLTLYGFLLASIDGAWDWLAARCLRLIAGSVVFLLVIVALFEHGIIAHGSAVDAFVANIFTWVCLMAFLGLGRRYLSFENSLLRWARDASYPVYVLHQTIIVCAGYFVIQQPWAPWTKYWLVLAVTLVGCVMLYEICVRRLAVMRFAFGMKAPPGSITATTPGRAANGTLA